jgi:hypothetical protein
LEKHALSPSAPLRINSVEGRERGDFLHSGDKTHDDPQLDTKIGALYAGRTQWTKGIYMKEPEIK